MGWNWGHMGGWGMGWGWLVLALLVIGVIVLVVILLRVSGARGQQQDRPASGGSRARDVLDERYARGEIDTAEYDERRRKLDGSPGT